MTKMTKFLALLPVVAFAVGCNGVAPSGPNAVASNDANEIVSGGVSTMLSRTCAGITAINLRVDETNDAMVWVEASYQFGPFSTPGPISTPAPVPCAAPSWRADRSGLTVDKANQFRAGFSRRETGKATLSVTAPNGVHNGIELNLTPSNSLRGPAICVNVTGVTLVQVRIGDPSRIALEATYEYGGPFATPCDVAPVWNADRDGLIVNTRNPFRASIDLRDDVRTTVTAQTPSGFVGSIDF